MVLDPPASTYLVPHGVDADAVTSYLAERLAVEADEPVTVETTVLDTVDRRLRAGPPTRPCGPWAASPTACGPRSASRSHPTCGPTGPPSPSSTTSPTS